MPFPSSWQHGWCIPPSWSSRHHRRPSSRSASWMSSSRHPTPWWCNEIRGQHLGSGNLHATRSRWAMVVPVAVGVMNQPCLKLGCVLTPASCLGARTSLAVRWQHSKVKDKSCLCVYNTSDPVRWGVAWPRFIQEPSKLTDKSMTFLSASLAAALVVVDWTTYTRRTIFTASVRMLLATTMPTSMSLGTDTASLCRCDPHLCLATLTQQHVSPQMARVQQCHRSGQTNVWCWWCHHMTCSTSAADTPTQVHSSRRGRQGCCFDTRGMDSLFTLAMTVDMVSLPVSSGSASASSSGIPVSRRRRFKSNFLWVAEVGVPEIDGTYGNMY